MKKLLFTALAVVAFTATSVAQMNFGIKAGLNMASLASSEEGYEPKSKMGFHLGGYAEFTLSDKISLQPELVYSSQGAKLEESQSEVVMGDTYSSSYEQKTKLNYLNIPVLVKFKPTESFSLTAGPQIGLLLSAKSDWSTSYSQADNSESESGEDDIKDGMTGMDLGLAIGAGYELESGLNFGLRYNYGLSDVIDENEGDAVRNSVIQLSVGFRLTNN